MVDYNKPLLTNAGALLADEGLVRHSQVFCTRWNGRDKDDALDDVEFSGGLLFLLRETSAFIGRHNTNAWEKNPDKRVDRPSYAARAITEALVNALIHRDYLLRGVEISVDIYDDRMTISSPGSMFQGGVLPDRPDLEQVTSRRRNPVIADLFHRLGLMERRGSGLRRICRETELQANFRPEYMPRFISENGIFTVTLMDMNYLAPQVTPQVTPQVEQLLGVLGEKEMSRTELLEALGLSDRKNLRVKYLNPAIASGLVELTIPDKPNSRLQKYRRKTK